MVLTGQVPLQLGGPRQCGMLSLSDTSTDAWHQESISRHFDRKPNALSTRPHAPTMTSYYKSSSVCLFVCLSVCLFVPYLLRGPLTDLRQTWWVYVGGPRNCPWGVLFRKGQRLDGSTGHFHFPLYYICTSLMPHAATAPLACSCRV